MERFTILTIVGLTVLAILAVASGCTQSVSQQNPVSCTPVLVTTPDKLNFTAAGAETTFQQALTVLNKGTGDLNWVIADNSPWIEIQQASGTSGSTGTAVSVVVNVKNMSAGDYTGIVTVSSQGALNSPVYVPVFLTVTQSSSAAQAAQQAQNVLPAVSATVSTTSTPPGDSAAAWKNQTDLYRYAGAYSCVVSGSISNTDAIWYMGDVKIITKSGNSADIADIIQPGEQVIYHRYIPCFDNEVVRLSYRWYRP